MFNSVGFLFRLVSTFIAPPNDFGTGGKLGHFGVDETIQV